MKWYCPLYLGEKIKAKSREAVRTAEGEKPGRYGSCILLTLSLYSQGNLDLLTVKESQKEWYRQKGLTVVGLASDKKEAYRLLERILSDCFEKTGGADLRAWFSAMPAEAFSDSGEVSVS